MEPDILARLESGEGFGTTKGERGTGLGFSIAMKYALENNCGLEISSDETKGTKVCLSIPYDSPE